MSIIGDMLDMEIFEEDQSKTVPFDAFLDGVVVIALDALGQDDHSKNMLVAVMLNMFYENMLRTTKLPFLGQDTSSAEHTSELQSLMRNSYAVFCLKKKTTSPD